MVLSLEEISAETDGEAYAGFPSNNIKLASAAE